MKIVLHLELDEKELFQYKKAKYRSKTRLIKDLESMMNRWVKTHMLGCSFYEFIEDERDKNRED